MLHIAFKWRDIDWYFWGFTMIGVAIVGVAVGVMWLCR
jgi:hypothetical protein